MITLTVISRFNVMNLFRKRGDFYMLKKLKKVIKDNDLIYKRIAKLNIKITKLLTVISPELASRYRYRQTFFKGINLRDPQTFTEKLTWLKLNTYYNNPLVTQCADKYQVRKYVSDCGLDHLLNDLIDVYDSADDIDWEALPNKFVLKANHGSGYNIICEDKSRLNITETKATINKWMAEDYWKLFAETNYKFIEKKITSEKYLETEDGSYLYDYKVYCLNGQPQFIFVTKVKDDQTGGLYSEEIFMDTNWEFLTYIKKENLKKEDLSIPEKPKSLDEMLSAAKKLSQPFPFVRVDFFEHNDAAIFAELTFTPRGGLAEPPVEINGRTLGEILDISKELTQKK